MTSQSPPAPNPAPGQPTAAGALPHKRSTEDIVLAILGLAFAALLIWRAIFGAGAVYISEQDGAYSAATRFDYEMHMAQYSPVRTLGIWVAAFCTLATFSFLYKDNVAYKLAESVFVGVSAAYWMIVGFWTVIIPNLLGKIWPVWIRSWAIPGLSPVRDDLWWLYLIPLLLGIMLLWRLSPKGAWIARWPLAFIIGSTAGIRLIGFLQADFLSQIRNSILPVASFSEAGSFQYGPSLRNLVLVLAVISTLVYFFFSIEHKGLTGRVSKVGVWVLMISFGAAFGYTVMGRIALLAIRFEFLFRDWLGIIP